MSYQPRHRRHGHSISGRTLVAAVVLAAATPFAGFGLLRLWPGYAPLPPQPKLVVGGYTSAYPARVEDGGRVLLPYDTVKVLLDPSVDYDPETRQVVIPTAGRNIPMGADAVTAYVEASPVQLNLPTTLDQSGTLYVPADLIAALQGLQYKYFPESNTVVVDRLGEEVQTATVLGERAYVRERPSLLALKLGRLAKGDTLRVYGDKDDWYFVRDLTGHLGYIQKKSVGLGPVVVNSPDNDHPDGPLPPPEGKVSLVWEHVRGQNPNPYDFDDMPGLNVVSPTWFHVVNSDADLQNTADLTYVTWAHERGYRVWGLVDNGFSARRTHNFLPDPDKRAKIIRQLLLYARLYRLDGINVDFENMYRRDGDDFVAFLRELAPLAHQMGLAVSVDVTFVSSSENWSLVYDRRAIAELADYVMVMGYDQHTTTTGPVGSLAWVENGLQRVLEQVPASKLVLGVPFYTRLWGERPGYRTTVTVYSMHGVSDLIAEKALTPVWDADTGQYFVSYTEDGVTYKLWIEDQTSMAMRVRLVAKYGLAGIAAWRRGLETPDIWNVIEHELRRGG